MRKVWLILLAVSCGLANAQDSTKMNIQTLGWVKVIDTLVEPNELLDEREIDERFIMQEKGKTIDQLLSRESSVYIKNYGPGQIKSVSIRGSGASRTRVYWNGVDLTPGNLGQTDVSVLQVAFVDRASVEYGNASKLQGFGGLGGALSLSTDTRFDTNSTFFIRAHANSMRNLGFQWSWKEGNTRWTNRLSTSFKNQKNSFVYSYPQSSSRPAPDAIFRQEQELYTYGVMDEFSLKISEKDQLTARAYYQFTDRVVPPIMINPEGDSAQQKDLSTLAQLEYTRKLGKAELLIMTAYTGYQNDYSSSQVQALNHAHGLRHLAKYEKQSAIDNLSINLRFDQDRATPYGNEEWLNRGGLFASYARELDDKWQFSISFNPQVWRSEVYADMYTAGAGYSWGKWTTNLSYGKNLRMPTLNDLYWQPGGNPNLRVEQSSSFEFELKREQSLSGWSYSGALMIDRSFIDNWIQWVPGLNGFWQPQNVDHVDQLGIELIAEVNIGLRSAVLSARGNYRYQQSISNQSDLQLIYTPEHQGNYQISYRSLIHQVSLQYRYVGRRYINEDHGQWLPHYDLIDLVYQYHWTKTQWDFEVTLYNVLNKAYMDVVWRPMPGRYIELAARRKLSW